MHHQLPRPLLFYQMIQNKINSFVCVIWGSYNSVLDYSCLVGCGSVLEWPLVNMVLYPRRLEWNLCLVFTTSVILHMLFYFVSVEEMCCGCETLRPSWNVYHYMEKNKALKYLLCSWTVCFKIGCLCSQSNC